MAFHWANNTIAYVLYNVLPAPDATLIQIFGGSQTRVLMAVGFSLCILVPAIIQLNLRLKKAGGSPTPTWIVPQALMHFIGQFSQSSQSSQPFSSHSPVPGASL